MRSALYYPYTSIENEDLIRTSLLLWDHVQIMVPWDGFDANYSNRNHARAMELIGLYRAPTKEQKRQLHELVEDFATKPLPLSFSYSSSENFKNWPIYRDKLLPDTWKILMEAGRAGPTSGYGVAVTKPTGLSLLSLLADCCAGNSLARITDQSAAYAAVTGLLTSEYGQDDVAGKTETLAPTTLKIVDTARIPLTNLISFREREESTSEGHLLRALRHRYLDHLSHQAAALGQVQNKADRAEIQRQFEQDTKDDLSVLRSELRLGAAEAILTKEVMLAVFSGLGAIVAQTLRLPMPDVVSATGACVSIGGLLGAKTKFAKSRREILKKHPMAYLYELKGGLRF